jgi:hypothetical protein
MFFDATITIRLKRSFHNNESLLRTRRKAVYRRPNAPASRGNSNDDKIPPRPGSRDRVA